MMSRSSRSVASYQSLPCLPWTMPCRFHRSDSEIRVNFICSVSPNKHPSLRGLALIWSLDSSESIQILIKRALAIPSLVIQRRTLFSARSKKHIQLHQLDINNRAMHNARRPETLKIQKIHCIREEIPRYQPRPPVTIRRTLNPTFRSQPLLPVLTPPPPDARPRASPDQLSLHFTLPDLLPYTYSGKLVPLLGATETN